MLHVLCPKNVSNGAKTNEGKHNKALVEAVPDFPSPSTPYSLLLQAKNCPENQVFSLEVAACPQSNRNTRHLG